MEEQKPSFYANIPSFVRYNKNLSANAKLLYGEITALCNREGYCWSSNEYFSNLYEVSHKSIGRWITDLENEGYIIRELIYKEGTKEVKQRRLYLSEAHRQKCLEVGTKMSIPMDKNVVDNNTINNTINKNNNNTSEFDTLLQLYNSIDALPKYRALSDKRKSHIKARIKEYGWQDCKDVLIKASHSKFLTDKNKGWFTIDWIFNPTNFLKILEGAYDDDKNKNNNNRYNPYGALESEIEAYKREVINNDDRRTTIAIPENVDTLF